MQCIPSSRVHCKNKCKLTPKKVAAELFYCKNIRMLTPKVVAVELSYLPTKQLEANISSVTNVKAFLPVIVVVFL